MTGLGVKTYRNIRGRKTWEFARSEFIMHKSFSMIVCPPRQGFICFHCELTWSCKNLSKAYNCPSAFLRVSIMHEGKLWSLSTSSFCQDSKPSSREKLIIAVWALLPAVITFAVVNMEVHAPVKFFSAENASQHTRQSKAMFCRMYSMHA